MAKYSALVNSNSASVVVNTLGYFAFHGVDIGSGPDAVTKYFYLSVEIASNTGF